MKKQQLSTELQEPNLPESDFAILKKAMGILNKYFDQTQKQEPKNEQSSSQNDSANQK